MADQFLRSKPKTRARDRETTIRRIREAAVAVLAASGGDGLTLNAVAENARVDKKLIYYYFGDFELLKRQVFQSLVADADAAYRRDTDAERENVIAAFICNQAKALAQCPALVRLLAWELASGPQGPNGPLKLPAEANIAALAHECKALDSLAISAIMLAGISHLALLQQAGGSMFDIDLGSPAGSLRIEQAVRTMAARLLSESGM